MSAVVRKVGALPVLDEASRTMTLYPRTIPLPSLHDGEGNVDGCSEVKALCLLGRQRARP